ncbi:MAG: complex I subunit 5 family protein [Eubacteriales bacterium]|nr:complex I subunit 5 family protein [Eubacteriales bacterium]
MNNSYIFDLIVFFPFISGLICYGIGRKNETIRDYFAMLSGVIEFLLMAGFAYMSMTGIPLQGEALSYISAGIPGICGMGLDFTLDGFRGIYGSIAALMWMMTIILSQEYFTHHGNRNRYYFFMLWTLGATMGVFLSASLYTTFVFFEIMSFTSYVWVAQEENVPSLKAAKTYLAVAVIGGLVMLMGLFLVYHELGTLMISELLPAAANCSHPEVLFAAGVCMLFGFGAKAGAFPLHIWLPKAHPVAPAPASALLSGILTKTGIYGILIITSNLFIHNQTWGYMILIIGELTMFGGALLAVFSIDLKRTLACSSMSQIGFILVGVGMQALLGEENALAVHGTLLHMVNHSLIKLVLFMVAGVVFMNAHSLDLNEIRGFGKKKNLLKVIYLVGAITIAGIPMLGGYVSKTLLHESIVEFGGGIAMKAMEWIFLISGGMTFAYMTKLYMAIFVEENEDKKLQAHYDSMKRYMNGKSTFALLGSAIVLFIWGVVPHNIMDKAAELGSRFMGLFEEGEVVAYYSIGNLKGSVISILIGLLIYVFFIRKVLRKEEDGHVIYVNRWPRWYDMEELLYRPLLLTILPTVFGVIFRIFDTLPDMVVVLLRKTLLADSPLPRERMEGSVFSSIVGNIRNAIQFIANRTIHRKNPTQWDYVHEEALKQQERNEIFRIIQRSLSFGLMLFGVGLMLTLIYIVFLS